MLSGVFGSHRQESPGADMQGQSHPLYPARRQPLQQFRGEMQSGGGCCDRALVDGEHGLIIGHIALVGRPLRGDVGRQRR